MLAIAKNPRHAMARLQLATLLLATITVANAHAASRSAPSAARASGGGIPVYDIEAACRDMASVPEVRLFETGASDTTARCVDNEKQAREQLAQQWSQFKATDRTMCIGVSRSGSVDPVYTELITCLEMAQDNHGSEPDNSSARYANKAR